MKCSIITSFPELYSPFLSASLVGRAQTEGIIEFDFCNIFKMVPPKERIDAPTFGPGPGMLIKPVVIEKAIETQEKKYGRAYRIFFSPQGKKLDQCLLKTIKEKIVNSQHFLLVAGRYEGFDARTEQEFADISLSIGDYVLMGGDLPAMVFLEGFLRLVPGVVGNQQSIERESFSGPFVDYPEFTEPVEWRGREVPEIIRSGNHKKIAEWRAEQQAKKTVLCHFEWLKEYPQVSDAQKKLAKKCMPSHYAALMHSEVVLPHEETGTTSVTSLDIHDGARSACTYGIKNYFIVTPLLDQQMIVKTLLDFWQGEGKEYNPHRHQALQSVRLVNIFDEVLQEIEKKEGKKPIIIATSANIQEEIPHISFHQTSVIWSQERPVLLVFGTGKGLSSEFLKKCDYILSPIAGFTDFNHLSVRSAMAIVFDRWLGYNPRSCLPDGL